MVTFIELQTMIILLEREYRPEQRNTPELMVSLIKKDFDRDVSEEDIINFYGLNEDWERKNRQIEYEYNF